MSLDLTVYLFVLNVWDEHCRKNTGGYNEFLQFWLNSQLLTALFCFTEECQSMKFIFVCNNVRMVLGGRGSLRFMISF